ncbi:oxidoreductase [Xylaria nigripes]|nr:oxidoreductase [Xylaria nigripes]
MSTTASTEQSTGMLLREAVLARHSSRLYLPKPIPRPLLEKALELARHSPSDSNTQPWKLFVVTGDRLKSLKIALYETASKVDNLRFRDLPAEFNSYRAALGARVYGDGWGLKPGDQREAVLSNYEFFGAPMGIIVCMSRSLSPELSVSVGMYMQTFLLALTELGLSSCAMFSVALFPEVVEKAVGIPKELSVVCGIAVGYEDLSANVNRVRSDRDTVDQTTFWVE